ncbi:MAG: hypothetical protein AAGD22_04525 [Verrucomicrobiota bacterium]
MAEREFKFNGFEREHLIQLVHGYWKGNASVRLDGESIYERLFDLCDFGFDAPFEADGVQGMVKVRVRFGSIYRYSVEIAGIDYPMS